MTTHVADGINEAYFERTDFLIVALTGRTGSGCTTTANNLCKNLAEIPFSEDDSTEPEKRKLGIARLLLQRQWIPFKKITVSTVILSFLLDNDKKPIEDFILTCVGDPTLSKAVSDTLIDLKKVESYKHFKKCIVDGDRKSESSAWSFFFTHLEPCAGEVRKLLDTKYAPAFQLMGDNIRLSGSAISSEINPTKVFSLMRRVKRLAKAAFTHDRANGKKSTRVVIDAVRNPLELVYLRDQFATFFSIAISTNDLHRRSRLERLGLSKEAIAALDSKEYAGGKSLKSYASYVSQNIQECIQKSDIFFANPGEPRQRSKCIRELNAQIVRYVALMLRPGLITPTRDERCMQLAFTAKLNSGCISRQVGAAIADENYSIKAVGWNDVPAGQVPCLLRDANELIKGGDSLAFSDFEQTDEDFRAKVESNYARRNMALSPLGLPCPICFKDTYNSLKNENNQVHTRSLHAEENAFLQLAKHGNSGISGGYLYTTASPCELCSKKAFQLGVKKVVYVDPYPGISQVHVLRSGNKENQPELALFRGAIGHAYHRLYDPLMPVKDEYNARLTDIPVSPQPPLV
ncbi:deoxycytidylate deaminase [Pseudoxanthomonas sp. PXM03]|uniref:deoxycytidylate deaminase n=1 Tax=Pseudoxanthomonas sp. PXM03 TaxID=2769284 RepID=UPI00177C1B7A|nr:deoxycytidylate deaminase [Pseudoxanthomonas sp. PXM03]MBD9436444.1 deoxycytidylate deaminase [Pseudoxanthomonas sp. PXM03]